MLYQNNNIKEMPVKIPAGGVFEKDAEYIPIAGLNQINQEDLPAIGKFTLRAPKEKTYVLGSIDGTIQWIATEDCDA